MTSKFDSETVRSQIVTTSTTFEPRQTFISKKQSKSLLDYEKSNINGFSNTRRFESNYPTHTNKVLDLEIYRPTLLYKGNYGTTNDFIKQQKQYFHHYSHKPYGVQPINYHPSKPYYEHQFSKYSTLYGNDYNNSGYDPKFGLSQYKTTGFQYNRNTVPPSTQRNNNFALNNQGQQRKDIPIVSYSNFTNHRYTNPIKINSQTYDKHINQKTQIMESSKVELIHSRYQQLNNLNQKIQIGSVSKLNQAKQTDHHDSRPLSPQDKWRQDKKKLAKTQRQVKASNKYNIYSCIDQPYERCLTKGCSDYTCPSNQVYAKQDYHCRQWN